MVDAGASCVVVDLGDRLGIVTDRDIRTRVAAAGAGPETPLSAVMTAPARTVAADRSETEALFEMLDHGVRHLPVLEADRRLVGVLDDVDLLASERRAPFRLRARIAAQPRRGGRGRGRRRASRDGDRAPRLRRDGGGDQPHDREHPRHDHPPADRDRGGGARATAGAVHVVGDGQLRAPRAVPELRRRLRAGLGRRRRSRSSGRR